MQKDELLKLAEIEEALAAFIEADRASAHKAFVNGPRAFNEYRAKNPGTGELLPYLPIAKAKAAALRALAGGE